MWGGLWETSWLPSALPRFLFGLFLLEVLLGFLACSLAVWMEVVDFLEVFQKFGESLELTGRSTSLNT